MKKIFLIPLCIAVMISSFACSSDDKEPDPEPVVPGDGNMLIAYFSYPEPDGVDASTGASRIIVDGELMGHVEYLAQVIHQETEADVFRIRTVQQYPASHEPLVAQASEEKANNARPALASRIENADRYDIIFIGYPNWWGDLPMPLYTFLESYDFSGKTLVPFNSHGGSGLSSTVNTIRNKQPNATVTRGFTVSRNTVGTSKNDVIDWLKEIGITD